VWGFPDDWTKDTLERHFQNDCGFGFGSKKVKVKLDTAAASWAKIILPLKGIDTVAV